MHETVTREEFDALLKGLATKADIKTVVDRIQAVEGRLTGQLRDGLLALRDSLLVLRDGLLVLRDGLLVLRDGLLVLRKS